MHVIHTCILKTKDLVLTLTICFPCYHLEFSLSERKIDPHGIAESVWSSFMNESRDGKTLTQLLLTHTIRFCSLHFSFLSQVVCPGFPDFDLLKYMDYLKLLNKFFKTF